MTSEQLQAYTRKELAEMARDQGVPGWHGMKKEELVSVLIANPATIPRKSPSASQGKPTALKIPVQIAVARNTSGTPNPEEQVGNSKYEVGTPTRDLAAKAPRDLPTGYGKDRIVVMVRDPYWLHCCYWELTRHAVQPGGSRPGLRNGTPLDLNLAPA